MENKKQKMKLYIFTYGKCYYIIMLTLAVCFFFISFFLLPKAEGFALLGGGIFFILLSFYLLLNKYMNYITLTDKNISTKKQAFSWNEVYITMSHYLIHTGIARQDYFIFFDDHYLNDKEIYTRRVKKDAFYLMVTPKRLEIILQKYNKKIQLLDRCGIDRKGLYNKILEYNQAIEQNQDNG